MKTNTVLSQTQRIDTIYQPYPSLLAKQGQQSGQYQNKVTIDTAFSEDIYDNSVKVHEFHKNLVQEIEAHLSHPLLLS